MSRIWFLILLFLTSASVGLAQGKPSTHCSSIAQGLITSPDYKAWLTVEIPKGSQFVKVTYFARTRAIPNSPWKTCPASGNCVNSTFPVAGTGLDNMEQKTSHWSAMVFGDRTNPMFYADNWVRMVVDYTTSESFCSSQQAFEANTGTMARSQMMLPPGKVPLRYLTFATELVQNGVWQACDDTTNPTVTQHKCLDGPYIGELAFSLQPVTDEVDGSLGLVDSCDNKSGSLRRGCRTVVEYKP
jgi:hypothetical protein